MLRLLVTLFLIALVSSACGSSVAANDAEYPDMKVRSPVLELVIEDPRKAIAQTFDRPGEVYRDESVSAPQKLPDGFEQKAIERLSRITGDGGLNLKVVTSVERADVTFSNDFRGDMTRYDVKLKFRVTTEEGTVITKGSGQTSQELPNEEATAGEMRRVFLATALNAFDQYFASEDTLEKINAKVDAYLRANPDEER